MHLIKINGSMSVRANLLFFQAISMKHGHNVCCYM